MSGRQFRVLYREFLFRVVDLEILTTQGDITKLLGQFAALLLVVSLWLTLPIGIIASTDPAPEIGLIGAWLTEHFLISTTMLAVGLFAVMSWDSMFPDRRDVLVLSPLPVRAPVLFAAKAAAVATALSLTVVCLNLFTGFEAPFLFGAAPIEPLPQYDAAMLPLEPAQMGAVLDHDLAPAFTSPDGALAPAMGAGLVIGIVKHGEQRIFSYGAANPGSIYEIGSLTKTFTGLLLARMAVEQRVKIGEPVRTLLPPGIAAKPAGPEITLLDLATHHSGLPVMPGNLPLENNAEAHYHTTDLYAYFARHGVRKPVHAGFRYSNLGFGLMGEALANRAGTTYVNLLAEAITKPLGMADTAITLSAAQWHRLIPSYDMRYKSIPAVIRLDALEGAGALRSTARDLLTYLEAQLHPEQLPGELSALKSALVESHQLHADDGAGNRIALAWAFQPDSGIYWHNGAAAGYTSYAFFHPQGDYAGVVLFNESRPGGFCDLLGNHLVQRLAGKPAIKLTNPVVAGSGGFGTWVRVLAAYWFSVVASGVFVLGCVLSVQGVAQLLPRQLFLRVSSWLQIVFFALLLTVYFVQPGLAGQDELIGTGGWLPSYWFFGLFQQMNGPIRPELGVLAQRAWIGLAVALSGAAGAYLICYFRTLRKIAEHPDIVPDPRSFHWLPRFGGAFETAVGQFSIRSLLRSRRHRVLLSFYLGTAFGLALFFSKAPVFRERLTDDLWYQVNASLIVGSALIVCGSALGTRIVFALPLEPQANWLFRVMPLPSILRSVSAIRRSVYMLGVFPIWLVLAVVFFTLWSVRTAAAHTVILGLLGMNFAELWLAGFSKIPFTCSYQPGKSRFHMLGVVFAIFVFLMIQGAALERRALDNPLFFAITVGMLAFLLILLRLRTRSRAGAEGAALQFDDPPEPAILTLGLHRDGVLPMDGR
jgi:CubicO group peptidase (beta-lactamase class C family)